jgi:diguanylate cyclase (GGDEF)-like protein
MALEKLSALLEDTRRWFEGQGKTHAAIEANQRLEGVKRAIREDSREIEAYGQVSSMSLTELIQAGLRGTVPNADWLALEKLVNMAIQKRSESLGRLRPPSTFPQDAREYADLRFQLVVGETRKRIDAERVEARKSAGPRTSPTARVFEVVEDRKNLSAALVRARLDTLVEALRRFGHPTQPFHDLILKEVSDAARAGAAGARDEIERMSAGIGGIPNTYALLGDVDRSATEAMGDAGRRLKLTELEDDHDRLTRPARSWRDLDPPEDLDLEVLAMKRVFDKDIVAAASESSVTTPLSMLLIDVDDLKQLNKRFTNPRVNRGLAVLAHTLADIAKGRGKAYRFGGDEFALLLPNASRDEAAGTGERLRAAIAALAVPEEPEMRLTVSVGVACLEDVDGRSPDNLQISATTASIAAKDKGKNRLETWPISTD